SGVLRYLGPLSSSASCRAPKPIVLPVISLIGHISRLRKRSYSPRRPSENKPVSVSSSTEKPRCRKWDKRLFHPSGAQPTPKCCASSFVNPLFVRKLLPTAPAGVLMAC